MKSENITYEFASSALPKRSKDSNKGTYGRLFIYAGCEQYLGAAHLALEAALRGGVGYVEFGASGELKSSLLSKFPETIFKDFPSAAKLDDEDIERMKEEQRRATATLIGSGSGKSERLAKLAISLMEEDGGALILDADALNSLSMNREEALSVMRRAVRKIVITPHPLEFSRISGLDIEYIKNNRRKAAEEFAHENNCTVILKGNGTVVTNGTDTYINTSGSSALAKAGSGDALAGLLSSLLATKVAPPEILSAIAVYVHGRAGDNLAEVYSEYGVTPSDLPKEMAKILKELEA